MAKQLRLINIFEGMSVLFMVAILFTVSVQIFSRYVLTFIPSWTGEEAVTSLMIWMINMGAAVSMGYNSHIAVDALVKILPATMKSFTNRLAYVFMVAFLCYFSVSGFIYVWGNRALSTPRLRIPTVLVQGSIPLSAGIMCCYSVYYLYLTFRKTHGRKEDIA